MIVYLSLYLVIPAIPALVVTGGLVTLGAIVGYFAARQVHPISFLKSLAISWLAIGLGCSVCLPLMMMSALSSGAYDPVRDDCANVESVPWRWIRLCSFVAFAFVVSIPIVAWLMWSRRPTRHGRKAGSPSA